MAGNKAKKRFNTVRIGIGPTKERCLQNGGVIAELIGRDASGTSLIKRYKAMWECPLDMYRDTNLISIGEHRAGMQFKSAYYNAVLYRRTVNERLYRELSITATRSDKIMKEAYEALQPGDLGLVVDVCAHDQHIWNLSAFEKLRRGLGHLAVRWHMVAIDTCEHKTAKS
jgi:hypothetical protein